MMKNSHVIITLSLFLFLSACAAPPPRQTPRRLRMQERPVEALPDEVHADIITVGQFRRVCDMLARDLVIQPFVARSSYPPVMTIRRLQNKTELELDEQIFQETIRVKLMESSRGAVLFRDDDSYKDIIQERLRQSSQEITVTMTDTVVETKTFDRIKEREFESGSLSGSLSDAEQTINVDEQSETELIQTGSVKSRIAAADYFLRGIIYQVKEKDAFNPDRGMNYFQYQFRVVDARSGLIVWEKMLDSKMEGYYDKPVSQGQQAGGAQGQVPPGFGSTQMQIPGAQGQQQVGQSQQPSAQTPQQTAPQVSPTQIIKDLLEIQDMFEN